MSNTFLAFILVVLAAAVTALPPKNYDGFRLYEVTPHTQAQLKLLAKLVYSSEHDYDFFHQPQQVAQQGYVIVSPEAIEKFQQILSITQIAFKLLPQSVTMILQKEVLEFQRQRLLKPYRSGRLSTDRYYSHDEIHAYIEDLAKRFPNRVFVKNVGRSYEGRTIKTLTITNGDGRRNKNVNFMDGGFHAREWISPAAVLYIIEQLVENFEENAELLQDYDWVILPVVNPDGYEYTQLGPVERLWRKTRKPSNATCIGTDPNRNFDFHWNEEGASDDPCSNIYAGSKPFSEPEALIVADLIRTLSNRGVMYLTMHSQGKMILYPWGWTEELPETWPDLHDVAKAGSDAIFAYNGTVYTIGSSTNVLYIAAGAADDYAFNEGFPIAFTMELPKGGPNLHDPPPSLIDWYVKETWAGVRAMAKRCTEKYPLNWRG